VRAGGVHVPDAMTQAQLERQVERAIVWGAGTPGARSEPRARSAVRGAPAASSPWRRPSSADALQLLENGRGERRDRAR
jgi:hypothetical protein